MGVPMWERFAEQSLHPVFGDHVPSPGVMKRLSGNGMHICVVGTLWFLVLSELLQKPGAKGHPAPQSHSCTGPQPSPQPNSSSSSSS